LLIAAANDRGSRLLCGSHVGRRAPRRDEREGRGRLAALGGRRALARVERGRRADRASRAVRRGQHDPDDAAGRRACRAAHRRNPSSPSCSSTRPRAATSSSARHTGSRPSATNARASPIGWRSRGPAAETVGPEIGPEISGDSRRCSQRSPRALRVCRVRRRIAAPSSRTLECR
jgi:hypothetical protein